MSKTKTASELHSHVPPDWYHASIKRNLLQRIWHYSRFYEVRKVIEPTKGKILDIGSADGVFTNIILKKSNAFSIIGIDCLQSSVDWANKHWKRTKKLKFEVGDAHKLSFPSNTFDAVFALEVMEHVFKPEKVFVEMKRVLKKGGYIVILVPSDNKLFLAIWWFVKKFWWARIWEDTHVQSFTGSKLPKAIKKAGFKIEIDKAFWLGMLHLVKARKV